MAAGVLVSQIMIFATQLMYVYLVYGKGGMSRAVESQEVCHRASVPAFSCQRDAGESKEEAVRKSRVYISSFMVALFDLERGCALSIYLQATSGKGDPDVLV